MAAPSGPSRWTRAHKQLSRSVRAWPLWALPAPLLCYLLVVVTVAVAIGTHEVATTQWQLANVKAWVGLLACGAVALEVNRHTGEPAGSSRDLLSAWTLPMALLLPPVYALLAPAVLSTVTQWRVGRSPLHRRVFSSAVIGLEGFARASLFQAVAGGTLNIFVNRRDLAPAFAVLGAVALAFVLAQVNGALIAVAVRLNAPEVGWRTALAQGWEPVLDLLEVTVGTVIAVGCTFNAVVAVLALPATLLLHRTLTHEQLRTAARTDAKTGLLNAATWQQEAEREITRAARTGSPLAVLIADLDHFKLVNDRHGHLVGDQVLAAAASALRAGSRPYDVLGRFGGEEFAVLLPGTDLVEAAMVSERLREQVAASRVGATTGDVSVTVSIGIAVLGRHGADLTDLLVAADLALYRAKAAGRNQVRTAPGT